MGFPLELQFHVPKKEFDADKERVSKEGLRRYLSFSAHVIGKNHAEVWRKAMIYAIVAFMFIALGYMPKEAASPHILVALLNEGLSILGWVLLWEALSLVLFSGQDVRKNLHTYQRFLDAEIVFKYEEESSAFPDIQGDGWYS